METNEAIYNDYDDNGIFDVVKNVCQKIASKVTGETGNKMDRKVVEKAVSSGAEKIETKVGNQTGEILSNKLDQKFLKNSQFRQILNTDPSNKLVQEPKNIETSNNPKTEDLSSNEFKN